LTWIEPSAERLASMARYYARYAPCWMDEEDLLQDAYAQAAHHGLAHHGMITGLRRSKQMTRHEHRPATWTAREIAYADGDLLLQLKISGGAPLFASPPPTPEELLLVKELIALAVALSPEVLLPCLQGRRLSQVAQELGYAPCTLSNRRTRDWRKVQQQVEG